MLTLLLAQPCPTCDMKETLLRQIVLGLILQLFSSYVLTSDLLKLRGSVMLCGPMSRRPCLQTTS